MREDNNGYPKYIDHIGVAVKDLNSSVPKYEKLLGSRCKKIEVISDQNVRVAIFELGQSNIELLEPLGDVGPINSFLEKHGEGIHHIALAVDNVELSLANAKSNGFRLIDREPRVGADGKQIGFLNPKNVCGVLIEFCSFSKI